MDAQLLLQEILELRLELTLCHPDQTAEKLAAIDEKKNHIQLIRKVPMKKLDDLIEARYRDFLAEAYKTGRIKQVQIQFNP